MNDVDTGRLVLRKQIHVDVNINDIDNYSEIVQTSVAQAVAYLFNEIRDEYLQINDKGNIKIAFEPLKYPQHIDCAIVSVKNDVSARVTRQYDALSDKTFCRLDVLLGFMVVK